MTQPITKHVKSHYGSNTREQKENEREKNEYK